ncbi:sulfur carrier protein [Lachnospiraceae bacterium C7]|nr:sulfur carrier protein [Lachnospiraceae bacterium C7]
MVTINGEKKAIEGKSISVVLEEMNFDSARVVVERNEEIVSKDTYGETLLQAGDVVEVISFVGGG